MRDYAVFDLEIAGFDPSSDVTTEVGWLPVKGGVPKPVTSLLVWAGKPVPEDVTQKTGITTRMIIADGVSPCEALPLGRRRRRPSAARGA